MSLPDNMPAQTRSKDRAAYAALSKKNPEKPKFDWAKIDAAAEAARKKKQIRGGFRFRNVGEDLYPGTGTHEDTRSRKSRGGHRSRNKTRKLRRKL